MFKDLKEGQTKYCAHGHNNTSGICYECLPKMAKKWDDEIKEIHASYQKQISELRKEMATYSCNHPDCPNYGLLQVRVNK